MTREAVLDMESKGGVRRDATGSATTTASSQKPPNPKPKKKKLTKLDSRDISNSYDDDPSRKSYIQQQQLLQM